MRELAEALLGDRASFHTLLPPASCPGHYDMRPADMEAVAGCELLLLHPWQEAMPNIKGVREAAGLAPERVHIVPVPGNWMLPDTHARAAAALADVLGRRYPEQAGTITAGAARIEAACATAGTAAKACVAASFAGGPDGPAARVLCAEQQAELARYLGLDVVATFGRPESMSVARVGELTRLAREQGVALVVDNLQSGDMKTGARFAAECGALHVVLSNFPGAERGADTWEQTLRSNAERLAAALAQWRARQ